jgi:hypothetical protein
MFSNINIFERSESTLFLRLFLLFTFFFITAKGACTVGTDCTCNGSGCFCNAGFFGSSSLTPATQICLPCPAGETSYPASTSCVIMTPSARPTATSLVTMSPTASATATASSSASAMPSLNPLFRPVILPQICTVQEQTIFNNAPPGTVLSCNDIIGGPVVASDYLNSTLSYSIADGNSEYLFSIFSSTGVIYLNSPVTCCTGLAKTDSTLNFESKNKYVLVVKAVNLLGLSAFANITINLIDVNEPPVLLPSFLRNVSENILGPQPVGSPLGVYDSDLTQQLSFEITGGNGSSYFEINSFTGQLSVMSGISLSFQPLDPKPYVVTVKVTDNGLMPITASLSDTKDYVITVLRNCLPGHYLLSIAGQVDECVQCPVGFTSPPGSTSATACVACAAGQFWNGNSCSTCISGTYQSKANFIGPSCIDCPPGRFGNGPSTTPLCSGAVFCQAGYRALPGARNSITTDPNTCEICPAGYFSSAGAIICSACTGRGSYSALAGSTSCSVCPAGQYTFGYSEGCSVCSTGSRFVDINSTCQPVFPGPTDTVFYLSGSSREGVAAFSGIYNYSNSLTYWTSDDPASIPAEALVSSKGGKLISFGRSLQSALSTGPSAFSMSTWVKCSPNDFVSSSNPFGVLVVWGQGLANWAIKSTAFLVTKASSPSISPGLGGNITIGGRGLTSIDASIGGRGLTSIDASTTLALVGTLAGDGIGGPLLDGVGTNANFLYPTGIAIDSLFNAYVADFGHNCIRKISSKGVVSKLSGSGEQGFADGNSTFAMFSMPRGIAVDVLGNIYVADMGNHRIRKVKPNGDVATLAGSTVGYLDAFGNNARFSSPTGVAVDLFGNVYVADFGNFRIRMIKPNGDVSTFAGTGETQSVNGPKMSASFFGPSSIVIDNAGENIFVGDTSDYCIRKISLLGNVSTLAGRCGQQFFLDGSADIAGFKNPQGIAIDLNGTVYVTDSSVNSRLIRKITPNGFVSTVAGGFAAGSYDSFGTNALFKNPFGIAADKLGNIFVTDEEDNRIRKILFYPGPFPVCDSTWHHIAITYSGKSSSPSAVFKTYIDGSITSTSNVFIDIGKDDATLEIFANGFSSSDVSISDLRFYNREVSESGVFNLSYSPVRVNLRQCTAGQYLSVASNACVPCTSGTYQSSSGYTGAVCSGLVVCNSGYYSLPGATNANVTDPATCAMCPVGSNSPPGSTSITACVACISGQSWNGTSCSSSCPAGQFLNSTIGNCQLCPAGTFSFVGATSCTCLSCGDTQSVLDSVLNSVNITSVDSAVEVLAQVNTVVNDLVQLSNGTSDNSIGGTSNNNSSNANVTALKSGIILLIGTITGVFSDAADTYLSARTTSNSTSSMSNLASLLNDTTILIPAAVSELLATNLASLTTNPAQLTQESASSALDSLSTILTLNLPINVLSGAVDAFGGERNASGVAPFTATAATTFLTAINNVLNKFQEDVVQVDKLGPKTNETKVASASASLSQIDGTLNLLTAAVLRSSNVGSAAISVSSAPSFATFNSSSTVISSFCGEALSLTAMRISVPNSTSVQQASALNLPLEKPLSPCLANGATVAKQQAVTPSVNANGAFIRTAKSATGALTGSIDASFVQYGVSPVPQTVGWSSIGGKNNQVLDSSSNLDTRVVSFNLLSQTGQKLDITEATSPMTLSIPFTNPLINSSSSSIVSSYSRLSFNITCPGKSGLLLNSFSTAATEFPQSLKLSSNVPYKNVTLAIMSMSKTSGQAVVSVPCGSPIGLRNITCGARNTSYTISYDCPSISLQPICAFWNETLNAWSSSGCFVAKYDRESISCSCNHTTNFAARFVALADMQEDLFSSESLSALAKPEELIRKYPHVFIIIGVIAALVLISSIVTYELDVKASSLFYETLRTDPEVKFLERIETLKGNVFILDRVMDHKIYKMQDKISRARLQTYAKEIAEKEGLYYIGHREILPDGVDIHKFDWAPKTSSSSLFSNLFSIFGSTSTNHEAIQARAAEVRLQAPAMQFNPMQLKNQPANVDMTAVTVRSNVAAAPKQSWLQRLTHKYTRAIYSRIKSAFEGFRVSANSNLTFISKAAGIPTAIVEAVEVSKENEYVEELLDAGQENIEEILHDIQTASTWTRFVKLRSFLIRTWVLFVLFNHPYISIFTKYDPRNPRYLRMLKISLILIGNLWATTFLYSFANEGGGISTIPEAVVLALLSCLLQVPISLLVTFFIRNASSAEFDSRYPFIAAELRRRARVEEHLSKMSQNLLEAELKNVSLDYKHFSETKIPGLSLDGIGLHPVHKRLGKTTGKSHSADETANLLNDSPSSHPSHIAPSSATDQVSPHDTSLVVPSVTANVDSPPMSPRVDNAASPVSEDDFDKEMFSRSQRSLVTPTSDDDFDKEMFAKSQRSLRSPHSRKSNFGPVMKNQAGPNGVEDNQDDDENKFSTDEPVIVASDLSKTLSATSKIDSATRDSSTVDDSTIRSLVPKASFSEEVHPAVMEDFEISQRSNANEVLETDKNHIPDDFSFGWIDAPPDVQRNCPGLLRCCGRHPDQREAFIQRMRKLEETKHALFEKKKREAQEKKNKKKLLTKKDDTDHKDEGKAKLPAAGSSTEDAAFAARNAASTALGMTAVSPLTPATPTSPSQQDEREGVSDNLGDYQGSGDDTGDEILGYLFWIFSPLWTLICNNGRVIDREKTVVSLESIVRGSSRNLNAAKGASKRTLSEVDNETETQDSILKQTHAKFSIAKILPCTVSMLVAISVSCLIMGFQIFYISLFGFRNNEGVTLSLTITWVISQGWSLFIIEPGMSLVDLIITFVIRPAWLPYLLWIPHLGPIVAGKVASDMVSQDGRSILSGRMQNLTLVRAAGAASQLSPELAVVAYGFGAVISATLSNVEDKLLSLSKKKKSAENKHLSEQLSAASKLSQSQRSELIVHRYILAQLHSVEEAQRHRKLLAMKLAKVASVKGKKRIVHDSEQDDKFDEELPSITPMAKSIEVLQTPTNVRRNGPSDEVTSVRNPLRSRGEEEKEKAR